MDFSKLDLNNVDLHTHTIASDGEMNAEGIIDTAGRIGLKMVSITDHDGVGAFLGKVSDLKKYASGKGLELITGVELDSEFKGVEIHILGYEIDVEHHGLSAHLDKVQSLRKKRISEIMEKVNFNFKSELLRKEDIFRDGRETLMKPHIVRELLKKKKFSNYKDASRWISKNCKVRTRVPKLPPERIISIILEAGGVPVLAHPAYYLGNNGIDLDSMIVEFSSLGLAGVEVYYDYFGLSPAEFTKEKYPDLISMIWNKTEKHGLFATRGSDSHTMSELLERNPRAIL